MRSTNTYYKALFEHNQSSTALKQKTPLMQGLWSIKVRRGRDSNSRYGYKPHTRLAGGRLQPLGHLSVNYKILGRKFTY